jgi:Chalcone isomerase-like
MMTRWTLALMLMAVGSVASAEELVPVPGTQTQFSTPVDVVVAARTVRMSLTGVGLRQKLYFNVYSIASYVEEGAKVNSAEDLAELDRPKQLHLVMERAVDSGNMAEAFRSAIRMNHPEPAFDEEVNRLAQLLRNHTARKGDRILLTHIPGVGLQINLADKVDFLIKNPRFSRAVWDIYLGKQNLGEDIKRNLCKRLKVEG